MSSLIGTMKKKPFSLIVRLAENNVSFAKAAVESGADALVMDFDPSIKDKKEFIAIIDSVKAPVGLKMGNGIGESEVGALIKLGVDFLDINFKTAPQWMLKISGIGKIASLDPEYLIDDINRMTAHAFVGIDAAIIPKDMVGRDLTVGDLQQYITIALSTGLPVIVPTQKLIRASELPIIWDTGAKGLILDRTITGDRLPAFKAIIKGYRSVADSLQEK